jgi:hypothetical protein
VIAVPSQQTPDGLREAMTTFLRVYLVNGRIYQSMVIVPQKDAAPETNKAAQAYLGSLRLTKP